MRYAVTVTRSIVEEATVYVDAETEEDATTLADEWVQDGDFDEDAEHIDSEYSFAIALVDQTHQADPSGGVCKLCSGAVRWTGTNYDVSPTGHTIPGPWVHFPILTAGDLTALNESI